MRADKKFRRPSEVYNLRGDASKAARELGWKASARFAGLVKVRVEANLERLGARLQASTRTPGVPRPG